MLLNKYHKLHGLNQHTFIISVSEGWESRRELTGSSAQDLPRLQSKCAQGCDHLRLSILAQDYSDCWQSSVLCNNRTEALFSFWLLAGDYFQLLEIANIAFASSIFLILKSLSSRRAQFSLRIYQSRLGPSGKTSLLINSELTD